MKKLGFSFILSLVAMAILGFTACGDSKQKQLEILAQYLNATCPKTYEQMFRLDKHEALPDFVLKFSITIIGVDKEILDMIDDNIVNTMKQQMLARVQGDDKFTEVKKFGATFLFSFNDEAGENLFEITITPEEYK